MVTALAFLILFGAALGYALLRSPMFGLYAYFAAFYVHPPSRWWGQLLPDLRWVLLAAVVTLIAIVVHREKLVAKPIWLSTPPALILVGYCLWLWIQNLWAVDAPRHFEGAVQYTKYLVAFYLVYRLVDSKERVRDLMFAHVMGCTVLGLIATYFGRLDGGRLDGVGGPGIDDANSLSMYLATGAIVGAGLVLAEKGWRRYVSLASLAFILNGFVLANTRGGLIALFAGGFTLMALKASRHRRLFWSLLAIGVLASGSLVDQRFIDRMVTIKTAVEDPEERDSSSQSRVELYKAQLEMFRAYPFGSGFRGTAALSPIYLDRRWLTLGDDESAERSSHNTYLTVLAEQGVPGVALFSCLLIWFVKAGIRLLKWDRQGIDPPLVTYGASICGALTVVLVAGLATDYLMAEVQFWLLAGLVCLFQLGARDEKSVQTAKRSPRPVVLRSIGHQ
jgi:hypothetical protein